MIEENARFEMENFFACWLNVKQRFMTAELAAQRSCRKTLQHNGQAHALKSVFFAMTMRSKLPADQ